MTIQNPLDRCFCIKERLYRSASLSYSNGILEDGGECLKIANFGINTCDKCLKERCNKTSSMFFLTSFP